MSVLHWNLIINHFLLLCKSHIDSSKAKDLRQQATWSWAQWLLHIHIYHLNSPPQRQMQGRGRTRHRRWLVMVRPWRATIQSREEQNGSRDFPGGTLPWGRRSDAWAILWEGEKEINNLSTRHSHTYTPPPVLISLLCGCSHFVSIPDARRRCHSSQRVARFYWWKRKENECKNCRDL